MERELFLKILCRNSVELLTFSGTSNNAEIGTLLKTLSLE
jgi:hypothetical protein